ncbi:MAG: DegV family EDD domain-containing protein [Candidatus Cloacimonetes bacterium]|nr:DegV family EDD domain-containing protein [Candidatus Cloacimonadota bacterium]
MSAHIKYLDGKRFFRALIAGGKRVIQNQAYLNKINVFPVADADTGSNLALTMKAIMESSRSVQSMKETINSVADAALSGARGNSGIIFAQYLHGLSRELPEKGALSIRHFADSAHKAVSYLYSSLMNPVEGTMLTVIREWAENLVEQSQKTPDFLHALSESLIAARQSLKDTPNKLKVLADAGVVDAGASGFVSFLEGIMDYIHKGSLRTRDTTPLNITAVDASEAHTGAPDKYRYCTEAILSGFSCSTNLIKGSIGAMGDSFIMAGGEDKLHLHIHTNEPDRVFAELFKFGEVSGAKVDDMLRQYQLSHEPTFPIGMVTDSASDLPLELLDHYHIVQIPFGINFGTRSYLDKLNLTSKGFYPLLRKDPIHPHSSQPSPLAVKTALDLAAGSYERVIAVHLSDKLSGIYRSSLAQASKDYPDKVAVIDSKQLSVTEGLMTYRVARAIEAGMSFEEIIQQAPVWSENTTIYTDINTLKYMVRGGRVPPLAGFIAAVLNLKPIVSLDKEGKALVYGKSFSRARNMNKIIHIIKNEMQSRPIWEYAIVHAEAEERAQQYADILTAMTGKKPAWIMPLSPVVGVHNGPGAVAIGVAYEQH